MRVQLGGHIPLRVLTNGASGVPAVPTALPTAKIVTAAGSLVETVTLLPIDTDRRSGDFGKVYRLGAAYSAGVYAIFYSWVVSGTTYGKADQFEIVAGGDAAGAVIGVVDFEQPGRDWLVMVCEDGSVRAGRDPR